MLYYRKHFPTLKPNHSYTVYCIVLCVNKPSCKRKLKVLLLSRRGFIPLLFKVKTPFGHHRLLKRRRKIEKEILLDHSFQVQYVQGMCLLCFSEELKMIRYT